MDIDFRNPDDDFVLHGGKPPILESKPPVRRNSDVTATTFGLTQKGYSATSSRTYRPEKYSESDVESDTEEAIAREIRDIMQTEDYEFGGRPRSQADSRWFVDPPHLNQYDLDLAKSYFPATFTGSHVRSPHTINTMSRPEGMIGALLAQREIEGRVLEKTRYDPVDYRDSYGGDLANRSLPFSPGPGETWSRTKRPKTATLPPKTYFLSTEAPNIAKAEVHATTPFQFELARLRIERLRLEEEQLLEIKRQAELERIRGPKTKWYQMKTPMFHYEARKNNELLRNQREWQTIWNYRQSLLRSSKKFGESTLHHTF